MSFSFRNRPKLSDRYRGKSGDEILNELKNKIDEDTKMFFESSPGWNSTQSPSSFSRSGYPADDMMSRGRQDIRSHLDDLAQRHPEFADHLRCPPWGGEMGSSSQDAWGDKRRDSGSSGGGDAAASEPPQEHQQSEEASPSRGRTRQGNLPQYGLRNTVDMGQQQHEGEDQEKGRGQRSWSAPPDNRSQNPEPQRFVSRLDIPINPSNNATPDQGKPPVAPKQTPHNNGNKQNQQGSTVRHIPIFVEGRDEPLLPKEAAASAAAAAPPAAPTAEPFTERIFSERLPPQPTFNYGRPSMFTARQAPPQSAFTSTTLPKAKAPSQQQASRPAPSPMKPQPQSPPPPQQPQQQRSTPSQPTKRPASNDPISRVQAVQKEVDELKVKVENYSGSSRKDREYLYLDEMLTRCLVSLDVIETEGKEDVRQARKTVIRNIQQCIGILETKVPNLEEGSQVSGEESLENQTLGNEAEQGPSVGEPRAGAVSDEKGNVLGSEVLKMDVENALLNEATQQMQTVSSSKLPMDTEPVDNQGRSERSSKMEEVNMESKGSENPKGGENDEQNNLMLGGKGETLSEPLSKVENACMESMEVENACNQDIQDLGSESKEKISKVLKEDNTASNKTMKLKSPKGSPKKGKHTN